jgi:hypothetical protein
MTFIFTWCATTGEPLLPGEYSMSQAELNWNCNALETAMHHIVSQIGVLRSAEDDGVAPTLSRFWIRVTDGKGSDNPIRLAIANERARAMSYNSRLQFKGSTAIDLKSEPSLLASK